MQIEPLDLGWEAAICSEARIWWETAVLSEAGTRVATRYDPMLCCRHCISCTQQLGRQPRVMCECNVPRALDRPIAVCGPLNLLISYWNKSGSFICDGR